MPRIYLTTLPYVNAEPHIGFNCLMKNLTFVSLWVKRARKQEVPPCGDYGFPLPNPVSIHREYPRLRFRMGAKTDFVLGARFCL